MQGIQRIMFYPLYPLYPLHPCFFVFLCGALCALRVLCGEISEPFMPPTRHNFVHLNEALRLKQKRR